MEALRSRPGTLQDIVEKVVSSFEGFFKCIAEMMNMRACRICKIMSFAWEILQILKRPDVQGFISVATFFAFLDPNWVPIGSRLGLIGALGDSLRVREASLEQFWVSF